MDMYDSQLYPGNLYLVNNVLNNVHFLALKVFNSDDSYIVFLQEKFANFACLSVCLYQINVKTAEPICPK